MKTVFKVLGVLVAVVIVLVAAVAVAGYFLIDPNEYKGELVAQVKEGTGRDLRIEGDIGLTFFPWLGVSMGTVELGNAAGFEAPVFARTEQVRVRVKLMPLLERRVEMDTVTLHGLMLNLERNEQGATNWEDLAKGGEVRPEPETTPGAGTELGGFAIGGLDIRDANVSWTDRQAEPDRIFKVKSLRLRTGALELGEDVDLDLGFDIESSSPPMSGRVEGSATVGLRPGGEEVRISGLDIEAKLEGETLPGGEATVSLGADATVNGAERSASVENLSIEALDLAITGNLSVEGGDAGGSVRAVLNVAEFSPRVLMAAIGAAVPETADDEALTKASLEIGLAGSPASVTVQPLEVTLDDSTLTGTAHVSDFAKPAATFDLALDRIDVDRYLPPRAEGGAEPSATTGAGAAQAGELPLEPLRRMDVQGSVRAGEVKVAKLTMTDVDVKLAAKDGVVRVSPMSAKLYQGTYAGDVTLDVRRDVPRLSLDEKLSGVQAGPLLADLRGEERLTGTGDVTMKLSAAGAEPEAIKKTLDGEVRFSFADGAVKGIDIGRMIRSARAKLKGESLPASQEPPKTDFTALTGSVQLQDGHATNRDLAAKSPLLRIEGAGEADLPAETVDYRLKTSVVATAQGQGGKELEDLVGVTIPIRISGTFAQPKYALDLEALAAAFAGSEARELVEGQKDEVLEKIGEKVGGAGGSTEGSGGGGAEKLLEGAGGALKGILGQ